MEDKMILADGTEILTVDIMNDNEVGVDAISPKALPLIPQEIIDLVKQRRDQMMKGEWDPFTTHEFVSRFQARNAFVHPKLLRCQCYSQPLQG
jgi:hypothetical protein